LQHRKTIKPENQTTVFMHISSVSIHSDKFPDTGSYPFSLKIFNNTKSLGFTTNVNFFAGENGCGKSTLLKAMTRSCGIHIWTEERWTRAHFNPLEDDLCRYLDIVWSAGKKPGAFFSAETYDHLSKSIDNWVSADPGLLEYFGGKSLIEQSHGESFMSFFKSRFTIEGVYFLDEPETALSPRRQLEFVKFLEEMGKDNHAQFFIATHSPILLGCSGATIYSFDDGSIRHSAYEETDHYKVYRDFIMHRATRQRQ
jgi:predicted ATPase